MHPDVFQLGWRLEAGALGGDEMPITFAATSQ